MKKKCLHAVFAIIFTLGLASVVSTNVKPAVAQASSYVQISKKGYYIWRDLYFASKKNRTSDTSVFKHTY